LTNHFLRATREIETQELRPGGKSHRAFLLVAVAMHQPILQQFYITQAVTRLILTLQAIPRLFPGRSSRSNRARPAEGMRSGHGRANALWEESLPIETKMAASSLITTMGAHGSAPGARVYCS
jgi:hypothetical protein